MEAPIARLFTMSIEFFTPPAEIIYKSSKFKLFASIIESDVGIPHEKRSEKSVFGSLKFSISKKLEPPYPDTSTFLTPIS